jgi:hypothetical protein
MAWIKERTPDGDELSRIEYRILRRRTSIEPQNDVLGILSILLIEDDRHVALVLRERLRLPASRNSYPESNIWTVQFSLNRLMLMKLKPFSEMEFKIGP